MHSTCRWSACQYLHVYACICMYLSCIFQYTGVCSSKAYGSSDSIFNRFKAPRNDFFYYYFSAGHRLVVDWPNHGPGVDVEERASRARVALTVALAPRITSLLAAAHASGNGAMVSRWHQGQLPQDMRERNNIQDRVGGREVHKLGAHLGRAGPPRQSTSCTLSSCLPI